MRRCVPRSARWICSPSRTRARCSPAPPSCSKEWPARSAGSSKCCSASGSHASVPADISSGKETCLRAAELARRLGDGELLARAVLGSAYEFAPGVRDLALIALLEEALAALPSGDGALRARCMAQLAAERQPEPDTQEPVELARAAVAMARRLGDADTLRFTLAIAGLAMIVFCEPAEQVALNQEALRLALAAGDKLVALRGQSVLTATWLRAGRLDGAGPRSCAYEALPTSSVTAASLDLASVCVRGRPLGGALRRGRALAPRGRGALTARTPDPRRPTPGLSPWASAVRRNATRI